MPLATESAPSEGPTTRSSIMFTGAGKAPARSTIAISLASSKFAKPSIMVPPSDILLRITGAICTFLSRTMATLRPILPPVTLDHVRAPSEFISSKTMDCPEAELPVPPIVALAFSTTPPVSSDSPSK